MSENEIAKRVLDSAFIVHTKLGPGLLESVYEVVLAHELKKSGLMVERQKPMPIVYDGVAAFDPIKDERSQTVSFDQFWRSTFEKRNQKDH